MCLLFLCLLFVTYKYQVQIGGGGPGPPHGPPMNKINYYKEQMIELLRAHND